MTDTSEQPLAVELKPPPAVEGLTSLQEALAANFAEIEASATDENYIPTTLSTGFVDLDDLMTGLHPGEVTVVAARPSMGKTAMVLGIAAHVAEYQKKQVGIFSSELTKEQVAQRILCAEAQINSFKLKHGQLHEHEWSRLTAAIGRLSEAPLYIDDDPHQTADSVTAKARKLKENLDGVKLLVVDYLQMFDDQGVPEHRVQEVSLIVRKFKRLARELGAHILLVSQLNRAVESRTNKRPLLNDLRDSGSVEDVADNVWFLYRDEYYNPDSDQKNTAEIIVAKHRNGPVGTIKLFFNRDITRFLNLSLEPGM
jgi:replicative DNA helicase